MKVYYAHCIAIYRTPAEDRDLDLLRRLNFDVINPSDQSFEEKCKLQRELHLIDVFECNRAGVLPMFESVGERIMHEVFLPAVIGCDVLAFRSLPDGSIPAGVAKEIEWAHVHHKPVIELPSLALRRTLTVEETRHYLLECGKR